MAQLKKNGWKILAMILLAYVHIMGLLVPLRPGIFVVESDNCVAGQGCEVAFNLYGAKMDGAGDLEAYLKFDTSFFLAASTVELAGNHEVRATFDLPDYLPTDEEYLTVTAILSSDRTGAMVIPRALLLRQDRIDESAGQMAWTPSSMPSFQVKEGFFFPYRNILMETIRSLYFHVPMWFAMIALFGYSAYLSIRLLWREEWHLDIKIESLNSIGLWLGVLGLVTGMVWADNAWGKYWSWDIKQTTTAITLFIYTALLFLRYGIKEDMQRMRITSAYNVFAFVLLIPLLFVIPRMMSSLHPGSGGNPGLSGEDLDNTMRMVFYPAVLGYILLAFWIAQLRWRIISLAKGRNIENDAARK